MKKIIQHIRRDLKQVFNGSNNKKQKEQERRRQNRKRWRKKYRKIYKRSEVKWNKKNKADMEQYALTCQKAKNFGLSLAQYLKKAGASNGLCPLLTRHEKQLLQTFLLESRQAVLIAERIRNDRKPAAKTFIQAAEQYRQAVKQCEQFLLFLKNRYDL